MITELKPEEGIAGKFVKTAFDENGVLSKIVDLKDYNDEECLYFTLEAGQTLPKQRDISYYELAFDRINE